MAEYGITYQGSKQGIAEKLIKIFPKSDNFYDLFGGGFSITHAMLKKRSNDYRQQFHFNEIRPGICELIKDAISGKYNYDRFKPKFVTREEFFEKKAKCAYTKIIWSFGNSGRTYQFGKSIESYKESMHNAIIFNKFNNEAREVLGINQFFEWQSIKDRRFFLRNVVDSRTKIQKIHLEKLKQRKRLKRPQQLQQQQQLERLERIQKLEQQQLERPQFTKKDYREVKIKPNSIVYCDIPYVGTGSYDNKEFNHQDFYDWAHNLKEPVFISEYNVYDPRFKIVFKIKRRSMFISSNARVVKEERVYGNKAAIKLLISSKG